MSNLIRTPERARLQGHTQEVSESDLMEPQDSLADQLRKENAELKARIDEMEHAWLDSQREYETLLEEKSEVIRGLHQKIQELQSAGSAQTETAQPDELLAIQQQLEDERKRLEQDEESLMVQMREMELSMAKERAEMARQRNELQRLQAEFNREVELASRDADLRERLGALQRRQQETLQRRQDQAEAARNTPTPQKPGPSEPTPLPKNKGSNGLLSRLFRK